MAHITKDYPSFLSCLYMTFSWMHLWNSDLKLVEDVHDDHKHQNYYYEAVK